MKLISTTNPNSTKTNRNLTNKNYIMKNKFRPIAMKCNQEQFDAVKPKLEKAGIIIEKMVPFYGNGYLYNTFENQKISTCSLFYANAIKLEIHETWNEKMFLDACGIEVEESFIITKDQILHIEKTSPYSVSKELKQWFPKAFEEEKKELIVGKWYVSSSFLINYQEENKCYGFSLSSGNWLINLQHTISQHEKCEYREATEQEVFEALKNEAVKRGYVDGMYVKPIWGTPYKSWNLTGHDFLFRDGNLYLSSCIFKDGQWAEIIQTITKEAAEKQLGKKII